MMQAGLKCLGAGALLATALAACQLQPAPPTPTAYVEPPPTATSPAGTAAPLATPVPASPTPAPSGTPTPLPSLTPASPPTPDPNLGLGEVIYADRLDGQGGWGWGYQEENAATFSTLGGRLDAVMLQPNIGPRFTLSPDTVKVGDQQLRVTAITNLCYERDEYGLAFRVDGQDSYGNPRGYVLKLTCGGLMRLEANQGPQSSVLVDWTSSPALVAGAPAENHLLVWAAKNQIHVFVNDKYAFSAVDSTFTEGSYAFFLRDRTNGGESVSFTGLEVRAVTLP